MRNLFLFLSVTDSVVRVAYTEHLIVPRRPSTRAAVPTMFSLIFTLSVVLATSVESTKPPHIILIIADDLGFNDVTFRGSEDIHTPNIDALGYAGRIFDRHYALPSCTSSRASLLTGKYAARMGMQGHSLKAGEPRGLPLNVTILPQFLKSFNYSTHLIGKWHEGSHQWTYTPTYRGYDTFFGFYNEMIGYFSHQVAIAHWPGDQNSAPRGYDLHRNKEVAYDLRGRYATELFSAEAEKLIWGYNNTNPFFLQLAHLAPHTGENQTENEVSNDAANDRRFGFIENDHRRRYAGAIAALDDSVGRIINALADKDMLSDSIVVFISDNGAPTKGMFNNSGSNWPLRGQKESLHEGGVRTVAVLWHKDLGPALEPDTNLFHITDWLPTIYEAVGGKIEDLGDIDGVSHWPRLSGKHKFNTSTPLRTELLINTKENEDAALIQDWWKYIVGQSTLPEDFRRLSGDPGRTPGRQTYNLCGVANSETTKKLFHASANECFDSLAERASQIRKFATLPSTCRANAVEVFNCTTGCLFNLLDDPCETKNLADKHPDIVSSMLLKLRSWDTKSAPQLEKQVDLSANPRNFGGAWVPWLDEQPIASSTPDTSNQTNPIAAGSRKTGGTVLVLSLSVVLVYIT